MLNNYFEVYESAGRVFESPWVRQVLYIVHDSPEPYLVQEARSNSRTNLRSYIHVSFIRKDV
jgi:hypothetical protein